MLTDEERRLRLEDLDRRSAYWDQFERPEPPSALESAFIVTRNLLGFLMLAVVLPLAVYYAFEPGVPARVLAWVLSFG